MTTVLHEGDPALGSDAGLREQKVSLYDALELLTTLLKKSDAAEYADEAKQFAYRTEGIMWLFARKDPRRQAKGHWLTPHEFLKMLNVPHAVINNDEDNVLWGDDYAKLTAPHTAPIS